ncbi:cytochrome P450 CYP72A219-like isoform X1 [Chenopodium quinoa]|uniref:cytochrome P450 CYP72A219-like isoform X1 n=1 Tax=Chenopodium quinoa TaxID=63459 RepID=UPI000B790A73|nr:cytochrome P450 CYP72A219-like isoform X1 [Chenopodium quinoa]
MMKLSLSNNNVATSLVCIITISLIWKAIIWVWLKPKKLERRLKKQGFRGQSYKILFGDTKEIAKMVKQTTSKPMEHFSNDFVPRIFPFHHQIIKNYGDRSFLWNGPTPTVMITKPEEIREIMLKIYDFPKTSTPLLKRLTNGLVRLEGHKWARERKLLNPAFHMEKIKLMVPAFHASCNEMIQEWEKTTPETGSQEVEMWSFLHNLSADAISRAAFGSSFEEGRRVFELLREHTCITVQAMQSVYIPGSRFLPTKTNKREAKIVNEMESLLKDMIQKRQKTMENGEAAKDDLLGLLLKSNLEGVQDHQLLHGNDNKQQQFKMSMKEVIEECKMFYVAGQDTTSSLLVWTLVLLSKHTNWQEQAREEIFATFGHNTPHVDGLIQLKKVNMILHEVLRLYSPVFSLSRKISREMRVGDMVLPAGVHVNLPTIFIHHSEKLWGTDAKEFNPERFSQGLLKATKGNNMCFFAFGWGPRICIGSNFAMMEAKMALAMILQRFSFELSPSYFHAPTIGFGTLRPQFGAKLIMHRI